MPELMGDIRAEPKPGTALRTMMEQHRHLDEFTAMVKARMELDEKYLSGLKTLRDSWNPEWNESGIWPLISPLLTHIGNEIDERDKTATELNSRFAALPKTPSPNALHKDGSDTLSILKNLETRYHQYEQCYKSVITPESIKELKRWRNHHGVKDLYVTDSAGLEDEVLPKHEREYRKTVVAQQTAVNRAVKWQADTLPDVLERHQQRAENFKSFLSALFTCYSSIHFNLSTSCSAAMGSNRAFSSSEFISPRHDETENEESHALLQAVDYHNYMLDGEVAQPIFGLGVEKTVSLIDELLDYNPAFVPYSVTSEGIVSSVFELEKAATRSERSAVLESWRRERQKENFPCIVCVFLMDEPLLPLPENIITQYRDGISRARLSNVMATHLPFARQAIVTLVVRFSDIMIALRLVAVESDWRVMGSFLSHNNGAGQIIKSIWRKWDIVNDCPFPEGVERVLNRVIERSEVVWKKTRSPYYTAMSNSPA